MDRRRNEKAQRGQAIAEMGFVVLLFVLLTCGIVDFGRMLMILNVVTHAARDGARSASLVKDGTWGASTADIQTRVQDQIATVSADTFTVTPGKTAAVAGGSPICNVFVTVDGTVPWLFAFPGLWGSTPLQISRTATFRYENSSDCPT